MQWNFLTKTWLALLDDDTNAQLQIRPVGPLRTEVIRPESEWDQLDEKTFKIIEKVEKNETIFVEF